MKQLKFFIIGGGIFVILMVVIFIFFFRPEVPLEEEPFISPTPAQYDTSQLFITLIQPRDTTQIYLPAQPIEVFFTQPVDEDSLQITVSPPAEILVNKGSTPNSLIISPLTLWENGLTSLAFSGDTRSKNGNLLQNPQTYLLHTAVPTLPQHSEDAY